MRRIAKFEKVSYEQFRKDYLDTFGDVNEEAVKRIYENIELPRRATAGSAGYDFGSTVGFALSPGHTIKIPTGIRCKIDCGWVLKCYVRSSLGFKYCLNLVNQTGIIDEDYYNAKNEGHIFIKVKNNGHEVVNIQRGDKFAQGVFVEFGVTVDDDERGERTGGFGSTTK